MNDNYVVRRLTPMECERLQGYPDFWTDLGEWTDSKGKKHKDADSPRYKSLGNSIATGLDGMWGYVLCNIADHIEGKGTMASLFDGIGGFPYIWNQLYGDDATLWASEIEEFPIAVTKKHFPKMMHLGDITKINGATVPPVNVVIGGSPCQDLSVAGKRAGLDGERSGLFMEQIRIMKEMRENATDVNVCRYGVWENVPGAFSSNHGEDFRAVLEEFCKIADPTVSIPLPEKGKWKSAGCILGDGYSLAWRVMDAQYFNVPQRRKRIALVCDFRGITAPEILFKPESLCGNFNKSREARQGAAADTEGGSGETGECHTISFQERAGKPGGGKGILIQDEHIGAMSTCNNQSVCAKYVSSSGETAETLDSHYYLGCGNRGGGMKDNTLLNVALGMAHKPHLHLLSTMLGGVRECPTKTTLTR